MAKQNIGIRVPDEVLQAIDARCRASGLSRTDVFLELIEQGLGRGSVSDASETANGTEILYGGELPKKVVVLGDMLAALTLRLEALERAVSQNASGVNEFANDEVAVRGQDSQLVTASAASETANAPRIVPGRFSAPDKSLLADLLTTGELYQGLAQRGFDRTISTLRRWLAAARETGELPDVLTRLGVRADFALRRAGNPKDSTMRWLRLIHPWELD